MSEHENTPAAPPEGAITRWGYDYVNQGDQLVERDDGGYVLYADHAAALASATARAERAEAVAHVLSLGMGRAALALGLPNDPNVSPDHLVDAAVALRRSADASHRAASDNAQRANEAEAALATAQAEAGRLRLETDDYKKRLDTERETSERERKAYMDLVRWLDGDQTYPVLGHAKYQAERITARFVAKSARRVEEMRDLCLLPIITAKHQAERQGFESDAAYLDAIIRQIRAIPLGDVQPGPSAEDALPYRHLSRWLADYHRLALDGTITLASDEGYQIEQAIAALNALARAPGGTNE